MPRERNVSRRYDDQGRVTERAIGSDVAGDPDEQDAVTGRTNDLGSVTPDPALPNSTFASRSKSVQSAENKAVADDTADSKTSRRRRS